MERILEYIKDNKEENYPEMRVSREPSSSLPLLPPHPLPPPADSPLSHHDLCIRGTNLPAALEGHVPSERQLMHRALVGTPGTPTRDSVEINRHNILMFTTTTPPDSQRRLISSADTKTRCLKRRDCSVHELCQPLAHRERSLCKFNVLVQR